VLASVAYSGSGIGGTCDPRFQRVRDAFERNFRELGELGAGIAVYWNGRPVVDLWGGWRDAARTQPWQKDTIVCMMSVAKGISATVIGMLVVRGLIDLEAPMAKYWPEFAQAGKEKTTVAQAFSHFAGVPVADKAKEGDIYDFDAMATAVAAQAPIWPAGHTQFYHSVTIGHLMGMLVKKVANKTMGEFLRDEISTPLAADYHIGLWPDEEARCANMVASEKDLIGAAKRADPSTLAYRAWKALPAGEDFNSHRWRASEIPSVNGHGTASAVARIYGALSLGGSLDGVSLLRPSTLQLMIRERERTESPDSDVNDRVAIGYRLNSPPNRPMGPNKETFGHSGAGGSQSFADPVAKIGYCYCCNRMHDGRDIGERAESLINATFASLA
jgi:CubicO group peptidase (beta-lactamase class C family)